LGIYPEHEKKCQNAERIKHNAMYIPVYPRLDDRARKHIARAIADALEEAGGPAVPDGASR
jgi:dTDP-4-amino-4,6-dideoxygalactose transaminase